MSQSKRRLKPYDRENLKKAYKATLSGMSVYKASRLFSVPESTLRDRTRHNVGLDCKPGGERVLNTIEEKKLGDYIVGMFKIGYSYTLNAVQEFAHDFAVAIGKPVRSKERFSNQWAYGFMQRSPQAKKAMRQAKVSLKKALDNYFARLSDILSEHSIIPDRIFFVSSANISAEPHTSLSGKDPYEIKSPVTVSFVAAANALGKAIPPFYVFPGRKRNQKLMKDAQEGSDFDVTENGYTCESVLSNYIREHLAKHAGIQRRADTPETLILYDGYTAHLALTLDSWAKEHNVVLFVLPPHSNKIAQPFEDAMMGPLKSYYYQECAARMQRTTKKPITVMDVARLTDKPYRRAFCSANIISGFEKSGIYPFQPYTIDSDSSDEEEGEEEEEVEEEIVQEEYEVNEEDGDDDYEENEDGQTDSGEKGSDGIADAMQIKIERSDGSGAVVRRPHCPICPDGNAKDIDAEDFEDDGEVCSVCEAPVPPNAPELAFEDVLKWGQCDLCDKWVHLKYCTSVCRLRKDSVFKCPACSA